MAALRDVPLNAKIGLWNKEQALGTMDKPPPPVCSITAPEDESCFMPGEVAGFAEMGVPQQIYVTPTYLEDHLRKLAEANAPVAAAAARAREAHRAREGQAHKAHLKHSKIPSNGPHQQSSQQVHSRAAAAAAAGSSSFASDHIGSGSLEEIQVGASTAATARRTLGARSHSNVGNSADGMVGSSTVTSADGSEALGDASRQRLAVASTSTGAYTDAPRSDVALSPLVEHCLGVVMKNEFMTLRKAYARAEPEKKSMSSVHGGLEVDVGTPTLDATSSRQDSGATPNILNLIFCLKPVESPPYSTSAMPSVAPVKAPNFITLPRKKVCLYVRACICYVSVCIMYRTWLGLSLGMGARTLRGSALTEREDRCSALSTPHFKRHEGPHSAACAPFHSGGLRCKPNCPRAGAKQKWPKSGIKCSNEGELPAKYT